MKKSKQKPLPFEFEFRLLLTHRYSPRYKATVVYLALRTIEEFGNFLYDIVVEDIIEEKRLILNIQGLRPPRQTLPAFGPAVFTKEYPDLKEIEQVIVKKPDGAENSFHVKITDNRVSVKDTGRGSFVHAVNNEEEWKS